MSYRPRFITHEFDILFDVFNELDILFSRVGIVKTEITFSSLIDFGLHKVESHSLTMPYMKISIGLRWETSQYNVSKLINSILNKLLCVQG